MLERLHGCVGDVVHYSSLAASQLLNLLGVRELRKSPQGHIMAGRVALLGVRCEAPVLARQAVGTLCEYNFITEQDEIEVHPAAPLQNTKVNYNGPEEAAKSVIEQIEVRLPSASVKQGCELPVEAGMGKEIVEALPMDPNIKHLITVEAFRAERALENEVEHHAVLYRPLNGGGGIIFDKNPTSPSEPQWIGVRSTNPQC